LTRQAEARRTLAPHLTERGNIPYAEMERLVYTPHIGMKALPRCIVLLIAIGLFAGAVREVALRERHSTRSASASMPATFLWAWERPEDLQFIDTNSYGIAFLAKTLTLQGDTVLVKPRLQPLKVKEGTSLIAVVRVEVSRTDVPALSQDQLARVTSEIVEVSKLRNVKTVQIDFDATASQREFYKQTLTRVRNELPEKMPLSITALASWCAGDNWLRDLPIDEAVPMFFRMGVEKKQFEARLQSGRSFVNQPCNNAAGVSTDELVNLPAVDRLYIFNPDPWSQKSLNRAMEAYKR
jgi:hypothetical protein